MNQETKNIFQISIIDNRFAVSPKYRLEKGAYFFMKREGWKWSPSRDAFVFNVNEEGARRIKHIIDFDPSIYSDYHFGGSEFAKDGKDELQEAEKQFSDEKTKATYESLISSLQSKAKAEKEAKEAKKEQADKNRYDRFVKIKEKLKLLENEFSSNTYDLSLSNYNMSDLLARRGVRCDYTVKELLEKFGMQEQDYEGSEWDVLEFQIHYSNVFASRWSSQISARRLMISVTHHTHDKDTNWMTGGSGHFRLDIFLEQTPKIDFKRVVIASKIADDNFKRLAFETYMSYRKGDAGLLYEAGSVNSIGMMREDEVTNLALASSMKSKFEEVAQ